MAPKRKRPTKKGSKISDSDSNSSTGYSKRVRLSTKKLFNLFEEDQDIFPVNESLRDPYSDEDGEYGTDGNYEPENGDNNSSDASLEIFPRSRTTAVLQQCRVSESLLSDTSSDEYPDSPVATIHATNEDSHGFPSGSAVMPQNYTTSEEYHHLISSSDVLPESISISEERQSSYDTTTQSRSRCFSEEPHRPSMYSIENIGCRPASVEPHHFHDENRHQEIVAQQAIHVHVRPLVRSNTPPPLDENWTESLADISNFNFDDTTTGPRVNINEKTSAEEIFDIIFTPQIMDYLVKCTNAYGKSLVNHSRPHTRNCRMKVYHETNAGEMKKFLALSLLQGQVDIPQRQKLFTHSDPLYYHPIFSYAMSGRRYEQLLRCLYASQLNAVGSAKITDFINMLTENFRNVLYPTKELSLDESLMLFRGRLIFRTYMKNKKTKYGIKFYNLTTADGYVLNIKMYTGTDDVEEDSGESGSKLQQLVLRLMRPYLLKGHELYMDNFYNSVPLSEKLLDLRTHTVGTLRSNRKGNPTIIAKKIMKKGEYHWLRKNMVYVSNWKDKRQVLMINTLVHPGTVEITNKRGQKQTKPKEVVQYNKHMSGIDRADQMISYYSSPRKTIRWYKKVFFHMLDISVWNAFYLHKKYVKKNPKYEYVEYREQLIKALLQLQRGVIGKDLVQESGLHWHKKLIQETPREPQPCSSSQLQSIGHWPTRIPAKENSKKKYSFLNCRVCQSKKLRRETSYRCKGCPRLPPLCPECFEEWHRNTEIFD